MTKPSKLALVPFVSVDNMMKLVNAIGPRRMTVEAEFYVRGGIGTVVVASHEQTGATGGPDA